jgi:hypothetical protein
VSYLLFCASLATLLIALKRNSSLRRIIHSHGRVSTKQRVKSYFRIASPLIERMIALGLPLLLWLSACYSPQVSDDILLLSATLILFSFFCLLFVKRDRLLWLERAHIYVLCSLAVYLYHLIPNERMGIHDMLSLGFIALFLGVILIFQFSQINGFEITTLDYLVIFLAFSMPLIFSTVSGSATNGAPPMARSITIMIILFYIVEYVLTSFNLDANRIRKASFVANLLMIFALIF